MANVYAESYTSVKLSPPPNWNSGVVIKDGQSVAADSDGHYTFAPLAQATLSSMLNQGWFIVSLTD